ncbi:hypothetical protein VTL71DRAFT_6063 [Oculimacula yallundae]|uniref:Uncharacterized protein n=1 Tax=Oculimacula yallundae TaxID=86028 RepID=A0ABR4C0F7_9HELO
MVLENASAPIEQDTFQQDGAPSSDSDPYTNSNYGTKDAASTYHVDLSKTPRPLPIFGALAGYTDKLTEKALTQKIANGSQLLHRALTQEEVDAFAFWTAKQVSIMSYGVPIGVGAGLWRCYTTAGTYQMPFYKGNPETFNPNVFPFTKMQLLKNRNAVVAWHAIRMLLYGSMGNFFGQLFFGSYSMTVAGVGEIRDQRLKPFVDAAKANAAKQRGGLAGTSGLPGVGQKQDAGVQGRQQDDASPGSGPLGEQSPDPSWGSMSETQQPEARNQGRPRFRPTPTSAPEPIEQTSEQPFALFDDASPTGGQGVQADIRSAPVASRGGSAWDRLRKGGQPGSQASTSNTGAQSASSGGSWSRLQKNGQATSDGYSYAKTEDGDLTRGEAQKDFDARVERERNGGDFVKGNGDQKRW